MFCICLQATGADQKKDTVDLKKDSSGRKCCGNT